jgi:hypothetical protein
MLITLLESGLGKRRLNVGRFPPETGRVYADSNPAASFSPGLSTVASSSPSHTLRVTVGSE